MKSETWDDGIEGEEAIEIASTDESPIRVQAGPGTGKTFAMKRRVWRLLEEGEDPEGILVCTFARTAANDLKREMSEIGVERAEEIYATTLHSYCFRVLRRNDIFEAYGRNPRTLLEYEKEFLLNDLKNEEDEFGNYYDCRDRLRAFEAAWARLQAQEPGWPDDPLDQKFETVLDDWLRFHKGMLVEEIIPLALEYLRDNPSCPERTSFRHVLVDEYQDLNKAEQEVVRLIADGSNLMIVGDEDQSIYSFKHAHPEGISNFDEENPSVHDIGLNTCRRCPEMVVGVANNLIARNRNRAPRELEVHNDNPVGEAWAVQWNSIQSEAQGLAEYIDQQVAEGKVDPGGVLVLAPREEFGEAIYDALDNFDVPARSLFHSHLEGNPKDLEDSKAQQAMSLLRLVEDPSDRVALRCWCGFGSQSLRNGSWERLRNYCLENNVEPLNTLRALVDGKVSVRYAHYLEERGEELSSRLESLDSKTGQDLLDALFPPSEDWAQSYRAAAESLEQDDYGTSGLWNVLRSHAIRPEMPRDVDFVRVMSLYKSKGLTADMVVVPGCVQGAIPFLGSDQSMEQERRHIQEQRRLFYVSITRTTEKLVLSSVANMSANKAYSMNLQFGGASYTFRDGGERVQVQTSQFLSDLGREMPDPVRGREFLAAHGIA